jgi:hypothetical protein
VGRALDVQVLLGGPAEHQRQHDLGEQDGLQVRLGRGRLGQPAFDVLDAGLRDGVPLAVRALAVLGGTSDRPRRGGPGPASPPRPADRPSSVLPTGRASSGRVQPSSAATPSRKEFHASARFATRLAQSLPRFFGINLSNRA